WGEEEPEDGVASPAFLVGFPRSGTTLTGQILASHPQVAVTGQQPLLGRLIGELPNLLGRRLESGWDLCDLGAEELTRVRRRYWALVAEMVGPVEADRLLVDKLPLNVIDLGFAYRFFPRAKVVVLLRDPRDACLSCFMQPFHLNQANVNFLDLERTARLYAAVMELWFHYREALGNPYLELRYEELVADPEGRARELLAFLGLPWDEAVLRFHELGREVRTPSYAAVASPIYREAVGRWRHYREQLAPVAGILQPFVEAFGYESEGG
ncbi:MAG: sulfotransferase, partial [Nitrospirae bacterium]